MNFYIFSFNRGRFLENCVTSIERHAPDSLIFIYDDHSDDPETISAVDGLSRRHHVIINNSKSCDKHGGLHANMQAAFTNMLNDELFCFIQDDMQIVRDITFDDIKYVRDFFVRCPDAGFLHPGFLKGCNRDRDISRTRYDASMRIYFRRQGAHSAGTYYSDVLISNSSRLRSRDWRFDRREAESEKNAKASFTEMGFMFSPFVMWLPSVPAYRGKKKTLALRYAERISKSGFYPFISMSDNDVARLTGRDPSVLPVAEDFLKCVNSGIKKPWAYYPLQKKRLLQFLDRFELMCNSMRP